MGLGQGTPPLVGQAVTEEPGRGKPQAVGGAPLLLAASPSTEDKWPRTERGQQGTTPDSRPLGSERLRAPAQMPGTRQARSPESSKARGRRHPWAVGRPAGHLATAGMGQGPWALPLPGQVAWGSTEVLSASGCTPVQWEQQPPLPSTHRGPGRVLCVNCCYCAGGRGWRGRVPARGPGCCW